jgi:hypothetical protein
MLLLVGPAAGSDDDRPVTVLVVGTDDWAIDQAAATLQAAGQRPVRCHESGDAPFPCNALIAGRTCPLELGIDVVLSMRSRPVPGPTPGEVGVVCGLRAGVPLVVAGLSDHNPLAACTTATVDQRSDLLAACRSARSLHWTAGEAGGPIRPTASKC